MPALHNLAANALSLQQESASHHMLREHPKLEPFIVPVQETHLLTGPDGLLEVPVLIMP